MKTKDILWWIVAILILGFAVVFFGSCEHQEVVRARSDIYEYSYDNCMYIGNVSGTMIHSATCNNPKHSCICYNEVFE